MPNSTEVSPANTEMPAAVLNLISEMQAKILNPDADQFTITLATLTLQGVMPMVKGYNARHSVNAV